MNSVADESVSSQVAGAHKALRTTLAAGGVAAAGAASLALLAVGEAFWAYRSLRTLLLPASPPASGVFGADYIGEPLPLVLLGDSLAVGYGAASQDGTVGVLLANGLASASERPVRLCNAAVIGAESRDLADQIDALPPDALSPGIAVIVIGGNEVMRLRNIAVAVGHLSRAVERMRQLGFRVVVATCPDMGTIRPFMPPLRFIAHWFSRVLATAQTIVVLRAGGRTVSLADTLGPVFWREPNIMFAQDHLHPSSDGYARAAEVLLPSVCAAAGLRTPTDPNVPHRVYQKSARSPVLVWLAFRASRRAGNETSMGRTRGREVIQTGRRTVLRLRGRIVHLAHLPAHETVGGAVSAS
jgi:lysophospholipase L1-like esterase